VIELSGRGAEPLAVASRFYVDMCSASTPVAAPIPVKKDGSGLARAIRTRIDDSWRRAVAITAQDKGLTILQ
jgi:hypothetical protein